MGLSAINVGLSGLKTYQSALDSTANNIANASTKGYQPEQVNFQEQSSGGVTATISKSGLAASTESSGTDLTTEIVNSIQYKAGFDLSAKIVKTNDEVLGTLVNIKA